MLITRGLGKKGDVCIYPSANDVRLGTATGSETGNLVVPAAEDLRLGRGAGSEGTEVLGTLAPVTEVTYMGEVLVGEITDDDLVGQLTEDELDGTIVEDVLSGEVTEEQ